MSIRKEKSILSLKSISTRNDFGRLYQDFYEKGIGAEIGVQKGIFSNQILRYWEGSLLCVDIWDNEEDYEDAKKLLPPEAKLIRGYSKDVANTVAAQSLDFVYIDADHRYESVLEDIQAWFGKVRKGGIISGHDYCRYLDHFGVIEAVNHFCGKNGYEFMLTSDDFWEGYAFPSWYFIK